MRSFSHCVGVIYGGERHICWDASSFLSFSQCGSVLTVDIAEMLVVYNDIVDYSVHCSVQCNCNLTSIVYIIDVRLTCRTGYEMYSHTEDKRTLSTVSVWEWVITWLIMRVWVIKLACTCKGQ